MRSRHGELRPDTWTKDWVCAVCGKDVEKGSGRRKHCSTNCQQLDSTSRRRSDGSAPKLRLRRSATLKATELGNRPRSALCRLCGDEFSLLVKSGRRLQRVDTQWCPKCGRESPEAVRFRRYGITPEEYSAALDRGCEICGDRPDSLHVDHDHSCCPSRKSTTCGGCVRGMICGPCNRALGMMRDDPERLRRAILYLERAK
ncbi:endonuclease VII domain-containing protein [Gordonia sp. ABSL49_1]|uniref:endonuclease VII domain-containing protein n=1 Tax=Gordonia sp. ABSL49_1 TaxID=2920941 RepID=UPI001F0DAC87|nr:endonuclease VII domain-containing protein [Gordonia sp. ABSL49_1]MCH5645168.1 endonuclease VII domain-containing protein [Gordonia sp. ABSL49_1]